MALALLAGYAGYERFFRNNNVDRESDGRTISKIVDAKLERSADLRVSTLKGMVQAVAADDGWGGWLPSGMVVKAPFQVDYFVDVGRLDRSRFFWNEKDRLLIVNVPDVRVGAVNVDESRLALVSMNGVFISRRAMLNLRTRASTRAHQVAADKAAAPDNLAKVREHGRQAVERLFRQALAAANIDATVQVKYDAEKSRPDRPWELSRSLAEIYNDSR